MTKKYPPAKLTKGAEGLGKTPSVLPSAKLHIKFVTIYIFVGFSFFRRVSNTFNGEYSTT